MNLENKNEAENLLRQLKSIRQSYSTLIRRSPNAMDIIFNPPSPGTSEEIIDLSYLSLSKQKAIYNQVVMMLEQQMEQIDTELEKL